MTRELQALVAMAFEFDCLGGMEWPWPAFQSKAPPRLYDREKDWS